MTTDLVVIFSFLMVSMAFLPPASRVCRWKVDGKILHPLAPTKSRSLVTVHCSGMTPLGKLTPRIVDTSAAVCISSCEQSIEVMALKKSSLNASRVLLSRQPAICCLDCVVYGSITLPSMSNMFASSSYTQPQE